MAYFDKESKYYDSKRIGAFFLNWLRERHGFTDTFVLLDIGGGNGLFAKEVLKLCPQSVVIVIDPSSRMLDLVNDSRIETIKGALPDQLICQKTVDYIHIRSVLHHLIGPSPAKSLELMALSLKSTYDMLRPGGALMLQDECYESYIHPTLHRDLLFYLLKAQNFMGFRIPHRFFKVGLEVCFPSQLEVEKMLEKIGFGIIRKHVFVYPKARVKMTVATGVKSVSDVYWVVQKPL